MPTFRARDLVAGTLTGRNYGWLALASVEVAEAVYAAMRRNNWVAVETGFSGLRGEAVMRERWAPVSPFRP
jgi:hypothetical protein